MSPELENRLNRLEGELAWIRRGVFVAVGVMLGNGGAHVAAWLGSLGG